MESVVTDHPARSAQVDLKRHFTQMSECPFSHIVSHIGSAFTNTFKNIHGLILDLETITQPLNGYITFGLANQKLCYIQILKNSR